MRSRIGGSRDCRSRDLGITSAIIIKKYYLVYLIKKEKCLNCKNLSSKCIFNSKFFYFIYKNILINNFRLFCSNNIIYSAKFLKAKM